MHSISVSFLLIKIILKIEIEIIIKFILLYARFGQPLQGMELSEKEKHKDKKQIGNPVTY